MKTKNIVWTIAGSDACGGAGIQADLKTIQDFGAHGCSVITAVTSQNTKGIYDITVTKPAQLGIQLKTLSEDLPAKAIKIGMLFNEANIRAVERQLEHYTGVVVCDPVMASSSGRALMEAKAKDLFVKLLSPHITILTPNISEAEALSGIRYQNDDSIVAMAEKILAYGMGSVLIKGGHRNSETAKDYCTDGHSAFWMESPRQTGEFHGTGCVHSSALTAALAMGYNVMDALVLSKSYINQSIRLSVQLGQGAALLAHAGFPDHPIDFPKVINAEDDIPEDLAFKPFEIPDLPLYPIVDSAEWVEQLFGAGLRLMQLRLKNRDHVNRTEEVEQAIAKGQLYKAQVIINDDWKTALEFKASGVHLGQDDISGADLRALSNAGVVLGVSAHSYYEISRALALNPSYIAIGTVYETSSKDMDYEPLGEKGFARLRSMTNKPVVAIGGLHPENAGSIIQAGADAISVISDLAQAFNLQQKIEDWKKIFSGQ